MNTKHCFWSRETYIMLYDTLPNTSNVTTCAFPIPTDIMEDVPLCAGHSADTACSDCYTCRRTRSGEGACLYRRARFAVHQGESNENPQKEAMQNRHPTVCSWWHSKSSAHVLCDCAADLATRCEMSKLCRTFLHYIRRERIF